MNTQIIITIVDGLVSVRCVGDMPTMEKIDAMRTALEMVVEGIDKAGE